MRKKDIIAHFEFISGQRQFDPAFGDSTARSFGRCSFCENWKHPQCADFAD